VVKVASLSRLVGARIKQLRKLRKLTQEELGELAQLQGSYIGGVERGERNISLATLERIIKAMKVSFADFFNFADATRTRNTTKDELIEMFTAELKRSSIEDVHKIIEVYRLTK